MSGYGDKNLISDDKFIRIGTFNNSFLIRFNIHAYKAFRGEGEFN
jgi:hypothetical protein